MSPSKMDRTFRTDRGQDFPIQDGLTFAEHVANALEAGFGQDPSRIKRVSRLTDTNERTVKNWFLALNAPSGESLLALMRHSPEVLHLVLRLAGHEELVLAARVTAARSQLREALSTLDELLDPKAKP